VPSGKLLITIIHDGERDEAKNAFLLSRNSPGRRRNGDEVVKEKKKIQQMRIIKIFDCEKGRLEIAL
jgi:hypothetical protein